MEEVFIHLAIILVSAFIVSYIIRLMKQPIIIGYIIAGIIISPFLIGAGSIEIIDILSEFGVAFLLFIVGLHLNPKVIKEIGISSLVVGLGQIALTFIATFFVAKGFLGYDVLTSIYFGIGVSFSSTIIIMKLLSDKRQLDSLYGKIAIGVLIIQDLVAIAVLMSISSLKGVGSNLLGIQGLLSGGGLIIGLFVVGYFILPRIMKSIARSQELLFLFSICWCFALAALFSYLGFSMEIGALIAGVILSSSPYATEISSKIRPLRDFFLIIFFIILGLRTNLIGIGSIIFDAIVLSLIAVILKPIILMVLMKHFGFTKRTNFLVGTTLGQISEFSLIVAALGFSAGHLLPEAVNTLVLTLILTILMSSYMIIYSTKFYRFISPALSIFETKRIKKQTKLKQKYDSILFGYNRMGFSILNSLKKMNKKYLIVDFNPDIIADLRKFNVPCLYGDAYDSDFLEELPIEKLSLIVSTIPELEANELLIREIRQRNKKCAIILRAHTVEDALKLYKTGANYVLTPHFLGGEYVGKMIRHVKLGDEDYSEERRKHIKMLKAIMKKGFKHPDVEKN
ncbi:MAG: cation:proton antiporter [Nanoarchaeota archaeon]|nr:cation:proton antiporter [Nanoarchaeota archaeon]